VAGQLMLTHAYQRGHTLLISLVGYSQIIFTSLLGIAIWNDRPSVAAWTGMALVIAGGVVAHSSSQKRRPANSR
jgi:drug/metabolite transporter (DMT)-like permease